MPQLIFSDEDRQAVERIVREYGQELSNWGRDELEAWVRAAIVTRAIKEQMPDGFGLVDRGRDQ
ncbi:MAG: hypothetical protein ABR529_01075 [Actinomycetota bacterium]